MPLLFLEQKILQFPKGHFAQLALNQKEILSG